VADAGVTQIEQGGQQLVEDASGFTFGEGARTVDSFEQLSVATVLHENVDAVVFTDHLVDLSNVFVQQVALQFDFSQNSREGLRVILFGAADLDGNGFASESVRGLADLAKTSLADCFF
jgi:hypothetical protein